MYNFTHGHTTNGNRNYATCSLIKNYKYDENIIKACWKALEKDWLYDLPITNLQNSSLRIEFQHISFSVIPSAPPVKYMYYFTRNYFWDSERRCKNCIFYCRLSQKTTKNLKASWEKMCAHIVMFPYPIRSTTYFLSSIGFLVVKIRNSKVDFKTGGTWYRVGQWTLMMKIYVFFYSAKSLSSN